MNEILCFIESKYMSEYVYISKNMSIYKIFNNFLQHKAFL